MTLVQPPSYDPGGWARVRSGRAMVCPPETTRKERTQRYPQLACRCGHAPGSDKSLSKSAKNEGTPHFEARQCGESAGYKGANCCIAKLLNCLCMFEEEAYNNITI